AQHFLGCGLRSFAFIGHPDFLYSQEREAAFRSALDASHHTLAVYHSETRPQEGNWRDDIVACSVSQDHGIRDWLLGLPRPTGVLAPNDLWAVELIKICREIDLRVPEDIAVLGVDNDDLFTAIGRSRWMTCLRRSR